MNEMPTPTPREPEILESANLRTNKNIEQMTAINDPGIHDWHAAWIDEKVRDHEVNQGCGAAKD